MRRNYEVPKAKMATILINRGSVYNLNYTVEYLKLVSETKRKHFIVG